VASIIAGPCVSALVQRYRCVVTLASCRLAGSQHQLSSIHSTWGWRATPDVSDWLPDRSR